MNLASALIKQIIVQQDIDTWSDLRKHYLPGEFQSLFTLIDKHVDTFRELPTFDDLKLSIRDKVTQERVYSIESVEVDSDAYSLLEYLKNEYAQVLILHELDKYIDNSIAMSTAQENVEALQGIIVVVENKVDLESREENLQTVSLLDSKEEIEAKVILGLNQDFDAVNNWGQGHLALFGGYRGSGKSIVCSNIANNVFVTGKSALYYTIEMSTREILQRQCAIGTRVDLTRLINRDLYNSEWLSVANWWADRFIDGQEDIASFKKNQDFEEFHDKLKKKPIKRDHLIDIVHDPELTIAKIKTSLDSKLVEGNYGVVIVDYINQITSNNTRESQYDWKAQIEICKDLKKIAQQYGVFMVSAYQTDNTGATRFSKGILDAPDGTWSLNPYTHEDACMAFNMEKVRGRKPMSFTSEMDWSCLKIGPKTALTPEQKQEIKDSMETGEDADDIGGEVPF